MKGKLHEDILALIATFASTGLLYTLCLVSKNLRKVSRLLLYRNIVITRPEQYAQLLSNHAFPIVRGRFDYEQAIADGRMDPGARYAVPPTYEAGKHTLLADHVQSLTLLASPPASFTRDMAFYHPFLSMGSLHLQPMELPLSATSGAPESEIDGTGNGYDDSHYWDGFRPIAIDTIRIEAGEDGFTSYMAVCKSFSPRRLYISSTDPVSRVRWGMPIAHNHWNRLHEINLIDCLPLRPDLGDQPQALALPHRSCAELRVVTVEVQKYEDRFEPVIGQLAGNIPSRDEWEKFDLLKVRVTGAGRAKELKDILERTKTREAWYGPEHWERMKIIMLEGEEGVKPDNYDEQRFGGESHRTSGARKRQATVSSFPRLW